MDLLVQIVEGLRCRISGVIGNVDFGQAHGGFDGNRLDTHIHRINKVVNERLCSKPTL